MWPAFFDLQITSDPSNSSGLGCGADSFALSSQRIYPALQMGHAAMDIHANVD